LCSGWKSRNRGRENCDSCAAREWRDRNRAAGRLELAGRGTAVVVVNPVTVVAGFAVIELAVAAGVNTGVNCRGSVAGLASGAGAWETAVDDVGCFV